MRSSSQLTMNLAHAFSESADDEPFQTAFVPGTLPYRKSSGDCYLSLSLSDCLSLYLD